MGIGWKTLNNQAKHAEDFSHDRLSTLAEIDRTFKRYHLTNPTHISEQDFLYNVQRLFERMLRWNKINESINSIEDNKRLYEKAIITEVIRYNAKKEYCFLSTKLEASIKSEGIALITSTLVQQSTSNIHTKKILEKGAHIYEEQLKTQTEFLIEKYNKLYPEASKTQTEILVDQHLQCLNIISKNLTSSAQKTILNLSKTLESAQHNESISNYFQQLSGPINHNNEKLLIKVVARQFIEMPQAIDLKNVKIYELLASSPYAEHNTNTYTKNFNSTHSFSPSTNRQTERDI